MSPSMNVVVAHLTKADRLDHPAYAGMLASARLLQRDLEAGRMPGRKVHAAPVIDSMSRDCRAIQ